MKRPTPSVRSPKWHFTQFNFHDTAVKLSGGGGKETNPTGTRPFWIWPAIWSQSQGPHVDKLQPRNEPSGQLGRRFFFFLANARRRTNFGRHFYASRKVDQVICPRNLVTGVKLGGQVDHNRSTKQRLVDPIAQNGTESWPFCIQGHILAPFAGLSVRQTRTILFRGELQSEPGTRC